MAIFKIDPNLALQQRPDYDPEYSELLYNTETGEESIALYSRPVHMQKWDQNTESYIWHDINTNIAPDGSTPGVPFDVFFKPLLHEDGAVRFYARPGMASFLLRGFGYVGREQHQTTGAAVFEGNTASFVTTWGTIVYEVLSTGLKETIFINSDTLEDPTILGLALDGLRVSIDLGMSPVEFETVPTAKDASGKNIPVYRSSVGLEIPFVDYASAVFPIEIDPTLTAVSGNTGHIYHNTVNPMHVVTTGGLDYAGVESWTDPKSNETTTSWYRQFSRFALSTYQHHTIHGACQYQHFPTQPEGTQQLHVEHIPDWGVLDVTDWTLTSLFDAGDISSISNAYQIAANSILQRIVFQKQQSNKQIAFRCKSRIEDAAANTVTTLSSGNGGTHPPRILFDSYDSFTQNTPSNITNTSIQINFSHGTGTNRLTNANDRRRIFYRQGTGHTAQQIIDNSLTPINTTSNTAISAAVSGLVAGTTYSFVVVDMQWDGTVLQAGARSTIQTATTSGGGTPTSYSAQTRRRVVKQETYTAQTRRKLSALLSISGQSKRNVSKLINFTSQTVRRISKHTEYISQTFRKTIASISSENQTRRRITKQISYNAQTLRKVTAQVIVELYLQTVRKVVSLVKTQGQTQRIVYNFIDYVSATVRKISTFSFETGQTRRRVKRFSRGLRRIRVYGHLRKTARMVGVLYNKIRLKGDL